MMARFDSTHELGGKVIFQVDPALPGVPGEVMAVTFTKQKVLYDINLDAGGETCERVDSVYVHPTQ